jgi:SAM-dependent methyltransferase
MTDYPQIQIAGGDTAAPLNLSKRIRIIMQEGDSRGLKLLDCGCGAGSYVAALYEMGLDAYGIEYDRGKAAEFQARHPGIAGRVTPGNLEKMAFDDASFGVGIMNEVLVKVHGFKILKQAHIWHIFENISGRRPDLFQRCLPLLRQLSLGFEQTPFIQKFGGSQFLSADKLSDTHGC